jgi:DNA-binding transcriptional LysR family regulator
MLDVRRLRLLCDLARLGTIAAVAAAHNYTASAVSQQLSALEREAGVRLLARTGRSVALTAAGRILVRHGTAVLAELEQATAALAAVADGLTGPLRIGAFPTAVRALLPATLVELAGTHPGLELMVTELDPAEVPAALRERRIDVGLINDYDLVPARPDPGLDDVPLLDEPVYLALPQTWAGDPQPDGVGAQSGHVDAQPARVDARPGGGEARAGGIDAQAGRVDAADPHVDSVNMDRVDPVDMRVDMAASVTVDMTAPGATAALGRSVRATLRDLRARPWILATPGTVCHTVTVQLCRAAGFSPRGRHHADDFTTVLSLVAAGLGASVVPAMALTGGAVHGLRLAALPTGGPVHGVWVDAPSSGGAADSLRLGALTTGGAVDGLRLEVLPTGGAADGVWLDALAGGGVVRGVRLEALPTRRRTRIAYRRGAGGHPAVAAFVTAIRESCRFAPSVRSGCED